MQVCDTCLKIYNLTSFLKHGDEIEFIETSGIKCMDKNCGGELFEVDELFAPIISLLNKKGYKTLFCCSGHIKSESDVLYCEKYTKYHKSISIESYIMFEQGIVLPNLPDGYAMDKNDGGKHDNTIRKSFNNKKHPKTLLREIIENTLSVLDWVEKLPEYKKEN